jgi:hypothetical protein
MTSFSFVHMASFSSPTDLTEFSDQDLRNSFLTRGLLLRNLFAALQLRGQLADILLGRASNAEAALASHAWMEVLHGTWVLTENVLAAFELLADPTEFDARLNERRKAAWSRLRDRGQKKRGKFVKKAWGYQILNTPALDGLYLARGLTLERGRAAAIGLATRSAVYLESVLSDLQAFHRRYEDLCFPFKHGRAVFNLAINVRRGPTGEALGVNMKRDEQALTTVRVDESPIRLAELRVDDELKNEIESTLATVRALVERQFTRYADLVISIEEFIKRRREGPEAVLSRISVLSFFVEPETDDERLLYDEPEEG